MFKLRRFEDHDIVAEWEFDTLEEAQDYQRELEENAWFDIDELEDEEDD